MPTRSQKPIKRRPGVGVGDGTDTERRCPNSIRGLQWLWLFCPCAQTHTCPLWPGPVERLPDRPLRQPTDSWAGQGAICCSQGDTPLPSAWLTSSSSRGAGCDSRGLAFPSLLRKRAHEPRARCVKLSGKGHPRRAKCAAAQGETHLLSGPLPRRHGQSGWKERCLNGESQSGNNPKRVH